MQAISRKFGKIPDTFYNEYIEKHELLHGLLSAICVKCDSKGLAKEILNGFIFLQFISKSGLAPTDFLCDFFNKIPERTSDADLLQLYLIPAMKKMCGLPTDGSQSEILLRIPCFNHELFSDSLIHSLDVNFENNRDSIPVKSYADNSIIRSIYLWLNRYKWNLDEFDSELNNQSLTPWVLGYIHESLLEDAHGKGAYYTDMTTCEYISLKSILSYLSSEIKNTTQNAHSESELLNIFNGFEVRFENKARINDMVNLLDKIKICDNACGSGNFLVSCMNILLEYKVKLLKLQRHSESNGKEFPVPLNYHDYSNFIKATLQKNLFGVDINPESVKICKMRLWLCYLSTLKKYINQLATNAEYLLLPNLRYNIQTGDSVIGFGNGHGSWKYRKLIPRNELNDIQLDEILELENKYSDTQDAEQARKLIHQIEHQKGIFRSQLDLQYYQSYCKNNQHQSSNKIKNKEIANIKADSISNIMRTHGVFHWKVEFPGIFKEHRGFDLIVGNPPYIRQEHLDSLIAGARYKHILTEYYSSTLQSASNMEWGTTSDLSVYFILRSLELLKENGIHSYLITSKWIKTAYGKPIRNYIANNARVLAIVDYSKVSMFATASIDVIVYFLKKLPLKLIAPDTRYFFEYIEISDSTIKDLEGSGNPPCDRSTYFNTLLSLYSKQAISVSSTQLLNDVWTFLPEDLFMIRAWIEQRGKYLGEMKDIEINSGIKTGFNDAFIISQEIKEKIDPTNKYSDIIKPVLKGKEIQKYHITKNNLYIIYFPYGYTNNWIKMKKMQTSSDKTLLHEPQESYGSLNPFFEEFKPILDYLKRFIESEPADFKRLRNKRSKRMKKGLVERDDQGQYWWELRACAYYDKFFEPKLIWQEISQDSQFYWDPEGHFLLNTAYMLNGGKKSWTALLNSSLIHWYFSYLSPKLGENGHRYTKQYVEQIPIIATEQLQDKVFEWCIDMVQSVYRDFNENESNFIDLMLTITDAMVYELYLHPVLHSLNYYEEDRCFILSQMIQLYESKSLESKDYKELSKLLTDDVVINKYLLRLNEFKKDKLKINSLKNR